MSTESLLLPSLSPAVSTLNGRMLELDVSSLGSYLGCLTDKILAHCKSTVLELGRLGFVAPSATFFQRELSRYVNILRHASCPYLVSAREVIQNSSDAGTTSLDIDTINLRDEYAEHASLVELKASPTFVTFADNGRWCAADKYDTYSKCIEFFLRMNGSSKDGVNGDGGFGVGRFVIIFCAPLWFFTARHFLVVGHFNVFLVLCRKCFEPVKGNDCSFCGLHERDTPPGTKFAVNYADLLVNDYFTVLELDYLRYCNLSYPIYLQGCRIKKPEISKVIHQGPWFTVSKTKVTDIESVYIIRTASGIPMFSRQLCNVNSEKGFFMVDLVPSVNYRNFDQARQSLVGDVGVALDTFFSKQEGVWATHDVHTDHTSQVKGDSALLALTKYEKGELWVDYNRNHNKHHKKEQHLEDISGINYCILCGSSNPKTCDCAMEYEKKVQDEKKNLKGPVECIYFFRNGKKMDNIPEMWLPGKSSEQIYVLCAWTYAIREVLKSQGKLKTYQVGFVFDEQTEAMIQGGTMYINPEILHKKIGDFSKKNRHKFVSAIVSSALHEVSHIECSDHDMAFAVELTNNIDALLMQEMAAPRLLKMDLKIRNISRIIFRGYQKSHGQDTDLQPPKKRAKRSASDQKSKKDDDTLSEGFSPSTDSNQKKKSKTTKRKKHSKKHSKKKLVGESEDDQYVEYGQYERDDQYDHHDHHDHHDQFDTFVNPSSPSPSPVSGKKQKDDKDDEDDDKLEDDQFDFVNPSSPSAEQKEKKQSCHASHSSHTSDVTKCTIESQTSTKVVISLLDDDSEDDDSEDDDDSDDSDWHESRKSRKSLGKRRHR